MWDDDSVIGVVFMIALRASILLAAVAFGNHRAAETWQSECVRRGVAEYDSKTGEWKWKSVFQQKDESDVK